MGVKRSQAYVLQLVDLAEGDRIVDYLTAEWGRRRGVARGARRKFSRFSGALRQLARVEISWFEKPNRDLVRVGDVSLVKAADELQADLEGALLSGYLAEHLQAFVQENEPSDRWFRLLDATLAGLFAGIDRDLGARYFEIWMLRLSGVFPAPHHCPECSREIGGRAVLRAADAALLCDSCVAHGEVVSAPVLDFLRRSAFEDLPTIARNLPSKSTLRRLEAISAKVRRQFLERELKSYWVLRKTLAAVGSPGL